MAINVNLSDLTSLTAQIAQEKNDVANTKTTLGLTIQNINNGTDNFVSTAAATTTAAQQTPPENADALVLRLTQEIETLTNQIFGYDKQIEKINNQIKTEEKNLAAAQTILDSAKKEFDRVNESLKSKQEDFERIQNAVNSATKSLEADVKSKQQKAIYEAMSEYNEEKDGNFNEFLTSKLSGVVADNNLSNLISYLGATSSGMAQVISSLMLQFNARQDEVSVAQKNVNAVSTVISNLRSQIGTLATSKSSDQAKIVQLKPQLEAAIANSVLGQISDAEKQLVISNKIDLTATFDDGAPKYIIAKGCSDGKYHIYEMDGPCGKSATSLAREYGQNQGFDIVSSGNGYMRNITNVSGEGSKVYNLTCVSDDLTTCQYEISNKKYTTSSPLVFDITGNGFDTTDDMIQYDIDGNGTFESIYDAIGGILCFDKDRDGLSGESGKECFGDNTDLGNGARYANGFEALKAMAYMENLVNGEDDNVLDENDIKVLEEKWGLKMKLDGYNSEAVSLSSTGITEINLAKTNETTSIDNFDGKNDVIMKQEGATFKVNGEEKEYADIWHIHETS